MRHTFKRNSLWYAGGMQWTEDYNDAYWFYGPAPTYHQLMDAKGVGLYTETIED